MRPVSHHARAAFLLGLFLPAPRPHSAAQPQAPPVLTRVEQIRALSFAQAAKGYPVHLKGVITDIVPQAYRAFLADRTGGVYFDPQPGDQLGSGQRRRGGIDRQGRDGRSGPVVVNPRAVRMATPVAARRADWNAAPG